MHDAQNQSLDQLFERVQVGLRMSKPVVKVLKATAAYLDMPFSGLIETVVVTALQGESFFGPEVLKQIEQFKKIYGMNAMLDALPDEAYEPEPAQVDPTRQPKRR